MEGEVKNAGECRSYVGTQGFKGFGEESNRASPLVGFRNNDTLNLLKTLLQQQISLSYWSVTFKAALKLYAFGTIRLTKFSLNCLYENM